MRKLAFLAFTLCSALVGCGKEDTQREPVWREEPRVVEPRLTRPTKWRRYQRTTAGPPTTACGRQIKSSLEAADAISDQQQCLAQAIAFLKSRPASDVRAKSDLAAAYYVRAQVEERPIFYLNAWEAVQGLDSVPEARFNRALIEEALGRTDDARRSWDRYLATDHSDWGTEAREHRDRLVNELENAASIRWPKNIAQLPDALRRGDRATVAKLIHDFPAPAERYLLDFVIPQWAKSGSQQDLDAATLLASAVYQLQGDPFANDVMNAILRAKDRRALREAHLAYGQARRMDRAFLRKESIQPYQRAITLFRENGSPLHWTAEIELAVSRHFEEKVDTEPDLQRLVQEIPPQYAHTAARALGSLAFLENENNDHVEALEHYKEAIDQAQYLKDPESAAGFAAGYSGVFQEAGDNETGWNIAWKTNAEASRIADLRRRHVRLAALMLTSRALGHPVLAMQYQGEIISTLQQALVAEPIENLEAIEGLKHHLSVAYRGNAETKLAAGPQYLQSALTDLQQALPLADRDDNEGEQSRKDLQARINAAHGSLVMESNPGEAISDFEAAIESLPKDSLLDLRVEWLTQMAKAQRLNKEPNKAAETLQAALKVLAREQRIQLRKHAAADIDLWDPYFERSQNTYRLLIDLLADGDPQRAFLFAEQSKALEPLTLVRNSPDIPRRFLTLTANDQPIARPELQSSLPADTYIFEYCVLEDKTLVWIVGRDFFRMLSLPVRREEIAQWREDIATAAELEEESLLKTSLSDPYLGLLDQPWKALPRMRPNEERRIVIVPDGPMRGLPFNGLHNPARGYFIEEAIVSVHASATLYVFSLLRDAEMQQRTPHALLIGNPAFDRELPEARRLDRLDNARKEVEEIREFYAPNATVLKDDLATVFEFLRLAKDNDVIHIAAHSLTNERFPSKSPILLAPTGSDDGKLDAKKLAALRLANTRAVVLASCSSAGGAPIGPGGLAPLVRPFIGAGVPAVVGSLWDFNGATATGLLVSFHRRYRTEHKDAAKALREAQIDALDENEPLLAWASFEVIGYASSPLEASAAGTKEKAPP